MAQKKLELKIGDIVEVTWLDTVCHDDPSDEEIQDSESDGGILVLTLGYLQKITKKAVSICSETFIDGSGKSTYTVIPRTLVRKMRKLK